MYLPFHEIAHLTKIHCYQFEYFENVLGKTLVVFEYKKTPQENFEPHGDRLQTNQHLSCLEAHKSFIMDKRCRSTDAFSLLCLPKSSKYLVKLEKVVYIFIS